MCKLFPHPIWTFVSTHFHRFIVKNIVFLCLFSIERDEPNILVVLVEEELVVLDLESRDWLSFCLPYLNSAHASAITCTQHILNVPDQLWLKLIDAGNAQRRKLSKRVSFFHIIYSEVPCVWERKFQASLTCTKESRNGRT